MIKDKNRIPDLLKELEYLFNHRLEIGIFSDSGSPTAGGEDILSIAFTHEFGYAARNIPERSFMRAGFDENESKISNMIETQIGKVMSMEITAKTAMGRVGEYTKGLIQRKITDIRQPPNKPVTIALKGSSNPLIDTGRMRMSITWRIV